MEEMLNMEGKSPDSSPATSLSSQHSTQNNFEPSSSTVVNGKQEPEHQTKVIEKFEVANVPNVSDSGTLSFEDATNISKDAPNSLIVNKEQEPENFEKANTSVVLDAEVVGQDTVPSSQNKERSDPSVEEVVKEPSGFKDIPSSSSLETPKSQMSESVESKGDDFVRVANAEVNAPVDFYSDDVASKAASHSADQTSDLTYHQVDVANISLTPCIEPSTCFKGVQQKKVDLNRGMVDTAVPFESVKEAVSMFGGIVDWKAHKIQTVERRKHVERELEKSEEEIPEYKKQSEAAEDAKTQVLKELDVAKRLIEELKLNLERAQTEEHQAKQDSELVKLRVEELEQGIGDEASVAAKVQLEVAKSRHTSAVTELKFVKEELEKLQVEYSSLAAEKELAIKEAEKAVSRSREVEKVVEELTLELISVKESLESAQTAHLEAEEQRIGAAMAREQDSLNWENELKQAEEDLQKLNQQLLWTMDLKEKLVYASSLLLNLKAELAAYMEAKLNEESANLNSKVEMGSKTHADLQATMASTKEELEEVKLKIEKFTPEINVLKVASASLETELEREKSAFATMTQREGMASVVVASLEAELNRTISEIASIQMKEREAREKIVELPKQLQQAAEEANRAKSLAELACDKLWKAKEEVELAKASASTVESRLRAAQKEIEAAKASESLARAAVKAMEETESAPSTGETDTSAGVALSLEKYFMLSKQTVEAEDQANLKVAAAISLIEVAKESELRSLEKLEEVNREKAARKEALRIAMEKDEKAKEGKLGVEQELRKWRADHEQRRKSGEADQVVIPCRSPRMSFEERVDPKSFNMRSNVNIPLQPMFNSLPEAVVVKKKKKLLFRRLMLFLARRKPRAPKSV